MPRDASHQLRTPLTALRLQLERTQELVTPDPAGALRNLEAAAHEIARLQRMIDGLLVLSRADRATARRSSPSSVNEVVAERAAVWAPLAEEQGVSVTTWTPGAATAMAVPGALDQIVDNYLDNAIAVAPEGTTVEIVVDGQDVAGAGPDDLGPRPRPWTRAHATSSSPRRSGGSGERRTTPVEGTGLGLAIVAHLAESSGGRADLAHRVGGGLDASVHLPAALPAPSPPRAR